MDDPPGASGGSDRVLRGGSWNYDDAGCCRAAYRGRSVPSNRIFSLGFRLARSVHSSSKTRVSALQDQSVC
ncbi:MAG: hypothetical protein FJ276_33485, partial [Planctomycetes bacterium]|nr:hypothetical protein [Planctomycetota bacterium]